MLYQIILPINFKCNIEVRIVEIIDSKKREKSYLPVDVLVSILTICKF